MTELFIIIIVIIFIPVLLFFMCGNVVLCNVMVAYICHLPTLPDGQSITDGWIEWNCSTLLESVKEWLDRHVQMCISSPTSVLHNAWGGNQELRGAELRGLACLSQVWLVRLPGDRQVRLGLDPSTALAQHHLCPSHLIGLSCFLLVDSSCLFFTQQIGLLSQGVQLRQLLYGRGVGRLHHYILCFTFYIL